MRCHGIFQAAFLKNGPIPARKEKEKIQARFARPGFRIARNAESYLNGGLIVP